MARKKRITKARAKELRKLFFEHSINGDYLGEIFSLEPFNKYEEALKYIDTETTLLDEEAGCLLRLYRTAQENYYRQLGEWGPEYARLLKQDAADAAKAKREQDELNDLLA